MPCLPPPTGISSWSVKVKGTLLKALRLCTGHTAHRGSRGIALLFLDHVTRRGVKGQRHAPAALYPRERHGTHCTGGWVGPRGRSGQVRKISPPTGIRSPYRPARSQLLYRLRYPARWTCGCWTASSNHMSNNLSRMQNQRLLVQFQAPDDGRRFARNILNFI